MIRTSSWGSNAQPWDQESHPLEKEPARPSSKEDFWQFLQSGLLATSSISECLYFFINKPSMCRWAGVPILTKAGTISWRVCSPAEQFSQTLEGMVGRAFLTSWGRLVFDSEKVGESGKWFFKCPCRVEKRLSTPTHGVSDSWQLSLFAPRVTMFPAPYAGAQMHAQDCGGGGGAGSTGAGVGYLSGSMRSSSRSQLLELLHFRLGNHGITL